MVCCTGNHFEDVDLGLETLLKMMNGLLNILNICLFSSLIRKTLCWKIN